MGLFDKNDRKKELEDLKKAMLRKFPSLGTTVSGLDMKYAKGVGTALTDHESVYFDPQFMDSLSYDEKVGIMTHEVMHVAFNHIPRLRAKDGTERDMGAWNIATDAVINEIIRSEGLKLPEGGVDMPEAKDKSAEDMYKVVYGKMQQQAQQQQQRNGQQQQQQSGGQGQQGSPQQNQQQNGQNGQNQQQQSGQGQSQQQQSGGQGGQQQQQSGGGQGGQNQQNGPSSKDGKGEQDLNSGKQNQQQSGGQGQQGQQQNQQGQGGGQGQQGQQQQSGGQGGGQGQQQNGENSQQDQSGGGQGGGQSGQNGNQKSQGGQSGQSGQQNGQQQQGQGGSAQNGQNQQQQGQNKQQGQGGGANGQQQQQDDYNQGQGDGQGQQDQPLPQQPQNHDGWKKALEKYEKKKEEEQKKKDKEKEKNKDKDKDQDTQDQDENDENDEESAEDKFRKELDQSRKEKKEEFEKDKKANEQQKSEKGNSPQPNQNNSDEDVDYDALEKEFQSMNKDMKRKLAEEIRKRIGDRVKDGGQGNGSGEGAFGEVGEAKAAVSWKKLLKNEFEKVESVWSYRRSSRENFYMPRIESRQNYDQPATEVILDTSGSIDDELLRGFLRQVKALLKDAYKDSESRDIKLKIGCFDDRFHGFTEIKKTKDIDSYRFVGRGGTCIDSACRAFSKDKKVNRIVFTDGYDGYGFPRGDYKNLKIIFVVFDNPDFRYSDGKVIHVKSAEVRKGGQLSMLTDKTSSQTSSTQPKTAGNGSQNRPVKPQQNLFDDYEDDYEM